MKVKSESEVAQSCLTLSNPTFFFIVHPYYSGQLAKNQPKIPRGVELEKNSHGKMLTFCRGYAIIRKIKGAMNDAGFKRTDHERRRCKAG